MIETAITCAAAVIVAAIVRDMVLRAFERHAAKPVVERMAVHEKAFEKFAIETREALRVQEHRLDELKAPQNHRALTQATSGAARRSVGRIA